MLFRLLPELQCDSDFMVAVRETIWDQELHANTLSYHHHVSSERVGKVRHWGMAVGVWRLTLRTVSWLIPHIPTAGWERDRDKQRSLKIPVMCFFLFATESNLQTQMTFWPLRAPTRVILTGFITKFRNKQRQINNKHESAFYLNTIKQSHNREIEKKNHIVQTFTHFLSQNIKTLWDKMLLQFTL